MHRNPRAVRTSLRAESMFIDRSPLMHRLLPRLLLLLLLPTTTACPTTPAPSAPADLALPADLAPTNPLVGARPYDWEVPASWDGSRPLPLVVVLHGFGVNGLLEARYLGLSRLHDEAGFLLAYPDGSKNAGGQRFWNAAFPADDGGALPDDLAYVDAVIDDMAAHYPVDLKRVFLVGHSNGAFMAQYFACRRPARVAAVASLAGGMLVGVDCSRGDPVALVEIHGDADDTIELGGGKILGMPYQPLADVMTQWTGRDGCGGTDDGAPPLDLEASLPGAETTVRRSTGCRGGAVELWMIRGGGHIPNLGKGFAEAVWGFLAAHPGR